MVNSRTSRIIRFKDINKEIQSTDIILDIGAYDCELLNHINPKEYHGVDLTPKDSRVIKVDVSYEKLPFQNNTFDKVIMSMLLSHVDNPIFALKEARRVLKDQGKLILVFSNIENVNKLLQGLLLRKKFLENPNYSYIQVFGTQEIGSILGRTGFKVIIINKRCAELFGYYLPFLNWTNLFSEYVLVVAKKSNVPFEKWEYGKKMVFKD